MSQPVSLCGQGQPYRTKGGQFTLSCPVTTGFKKCRYGPTGSSYVAGSGNAWSPLFMRDPHTLCGQEPHRQCISFKLVISFQYHRFLSHTPLWPQVTVIPALLTSQGCVEAEWENVWRTSVNPRKCRGLRWWDKVASELKAEFLCANRELVLK